jgi:hypothetical protein
LRYRMEHVVRLTDPHKKFQIPVEYFMRDLLRWFQFCEEDETVPVKV